MHIKPAKQKNNVSITFTSY